MGQGSQRCSRSRSAGGSFSDQDHADDEFRAENDKRAHKRRRTFATFEIVVDGPDMPQYGSCGAAEREPYTRHCRIGGYEWNVEFRYYARANDALADIDSDDAQCKTQALRSQSVRAAGITAAHRSNVDTAT